MARIHEELRKRADIVIFDSSPMLVTADAQLLANESDGVLFVVEMGGTSRTAVHAASEMLRQAHARLLGVVFNKISAPGGHAYGYGYGYGRGYKYGYGYRYGHGYYGGYGAYAPYVSEIPPDDEEHKELAVAFQTFPLEEANGSDHAPPAGDEQPAAEENANADEHAS